MPRPTSLDHIYGALADPTRRAIVAYLAKGDVNVGALADRFPISLNGVSKHVKVLERAGLIERSIHGREHRIRLNPRPLRRAVRWLDHYRRFWDERLDALEAFLVKPPMTAPDDPATVVVRRVIPVPRERVFAAWLDPDSLAQWMCPGDVTHAIVNVDPRVGGAFRIVMEHGRGDTEHWGEYVTIEPPSRLAFTWISANTDRQPTLVTVELADRGGSTDLTLIHRRLPPAKVEPHRKGWTDIVRKLGDVLGV